MRLLINNKLETATLTVNVPSDAFPIGNLISQILVERVEFTDWIEIDLGSAQKITAVAFANNSDAITIQGNTVNVWGAPPFSQALTEEVTFIDETFRFWRIFVGSAVSRLGYFYLGEFLQLPHNDIATYPDPETNDIEGITSNRQIHTTQGTVYNLQNVNFEFTTLQERQDFENWWRSPDRATNHFFVPYELLIATNPPYFAKITDYEQDRDHKEFGFTMTVTEAK